MLAVRSTPVAVQKEHGGEKERKLRGALNSNHDEIP